MTQIIAAITQEYVLVASDRRLTYGDGPRKGEVYDDNTCKLVSLCGTSGIAYSGVGEMVRQAPTHEWIAKILANAACRDARCAEQTLVNRTPSALPGYPRKLLGLTFLFAGWAYFGDPPIIRPYWAAVTNELDAGFKTAPIPLGSFNSFRKYLRNGEAPHCVAIGEPLTTVRARELKRNLQRLVDREIGPKEALRLLVDEIVNTSKRCDRVGSKVLAFCIVHRACAQPCQVESARLPQ
jgi:hypothetical protein